VIGTAVPASSEGRKRLRRCGRWPKVRSPRQAMLRLFRERMRGQPGRGAGRDGLSIARRGFQRFRSKGAKRDAEDDHPKKGRRTSVGFDFRVRPGGAKQKRGFGWRTGVEVAWLLFGGSGRWEATPELVSRSSWIGFPWDLVQEVWRILRSAQWGLAAMPAPISLWPGAFAPTRPSLLPFSPVSAPAGPNPDSRVRGVKAAAVSLPERARKESFSCLPSPR
jgi:hypothetical protein